MISIGLRLPFLIAVFAVNFTIPKEESIRRSSDKAQKQAEKKKQEIEKAILKNKDVVYDEECSPSGICYIIQDEVKRVEGQIVARRFMKIKNTKIFFTVMHLEVPERLTWDNTKPKNWPISKLIVPTEYCQMQIAIGFITGALKIESMAKQQILMIGLGGGSSSSFLSQLHNMDIQLEVTVVELDSFIVQLAAKYFDYKSEEGLLSTVIQDGVQFLEDAVAAGKKYRSILLDACYGDDDMKTGLICPIKDFLSEKVIQNLYDVLDEGGVLSANLLSLKDSYAHEKEALEEYSKVFPSCELVPYLRARNMLVCSKKDEWTWKEQRKIFQKNLAKIIEIFDFQQLRVLYDF